MQLKALVYIRQLLSTSAALTYKAAWLSGGMGIGLASAKCHGEVPWGVSLQEPAVDVTIMALMSRRSKLRAASHEFQGFDEPPTR